MAIVVTTELVKELRDKTGISVMQCRKALEEAEGDMNKALAILKKSSSDIALKKADREVAAGVVSAYIHGNATIGVLLELGCETDFVAKNEEFVALAKDLAMHVCAMSPTSIDNEDGLGEESALLKQAFIKDPSMTVEQKLQAVVQKFGENTKVIKFTRYAI